MSEHEKNLTRGVFRCCRRLLEMRDGPNQVDIMSPSGAMKLSEEMSTMKAILLHHPLWLEVVSEERPLTNPVLPYERCKELHAKGLPGDTVLVYVDAAYNFQRERIEALYKRKEHYREMGNRITIKLVNEHNKSTEGLRARIAQLEAVVKAALGVYQTGLDMGHHTEVSTAKYDELGQALATLDNTEDAEPCERCGGTGAVDAYWDEPKRIACPKCKDKPCDVCGGKGYVHNAEQKNFHENVPCPKCKGTETEEK